MTPLIITVAPNGARRGKADHPAIPLTPDEIGREAARCRDAGAAMIHLHVRDAAGRHTLDPDAYRAAIAAVRREAGPDLLIQATTEAVGIYTAEQQMAAMRALRPEAFSAAVRELVPDAGAESAAAGFLAEQAHAGTLVQHILYDDADVARFDDLMRRGVIPETNAGVLFVLGRYTAGQQSDPRDLLPFLNAWTRPLPWAVCAFGRREAACMAAAAALGGHVRVGFENNMDLPDGTRAPDNAALVSAVAALAPVLGRAVATPEQARRLFAHTI
ncbi:3-keto-5-aminohexanoate cleavage protein [Azospirillum sp.]|uniref:3-keto-5-aminohexanoate cleavage protein n=1 Tax=Azospirillum sp. TaxID=34012 RepID=UPI002D2CAE53|nr:3-keto-5-aminohexanoate cleavage protein [Azospirillum sp.]HYD64127.1 3-keto-5-aminohexanoate cleavage protein [Azospirillum sp.]